MQEYSLNFCKRFSVKWKATKRKAKTFGGLGTQTNIGAPEALTLTAGTIGPLELPMWRFNVEYYAMPRGGESSYMYSGVSTENFRQNMASF